MSDCLVLTLSLLIKLNGSKAVLQHSDLHSSVAQSLVNIYHHTASTTLERKIEHLRVVTPERYLARTIGHGGAGEESDSALREAIEARSWNVTQGNLSKSLPRKFWKPRDDSKKIGTVARPSQDLLDEPSSERQDRAGTPGWKNSGPRTGSWSVSTSDHSFSEQILEDDNIDIAHSLELAPHSDSEEMLDDLSADEYIFWGEPDADEDILWASQRSSAIVFPDEPAHRRQSDLTHQDLDILDHWVSDVQESLAQDCSQDD